MAFPASAITTLVTPVTAIVLPKKIIKLQKSEIHSILQKLGEPELLQTCLIKGSGRESLGTTVTSFNSRPCHVHRPFFIHVHSYQVSATSSVKQLPRMQQFHVPPKYKMHFTYTKDKLLGFIPDSVKQFPWKEAKGVTQQELLVLGKEALKWSLTAILIFSFASDIIYSVSRNKELLIPFGLFVGCLMTNYLNEVFQELSHHDKERGMTWQLLGIYCFFIFVNVISVYFPVGGKVFLLHVANGGLMQVLWLWKSLWELDKDEREIYG